MNMFHITLSEIHRFITWSFITNISFVFLLNGFVLGGNTQLHCSIQFSTSKFVSSYLLHKSNQMRLQVVVTEECSKAPLKYSSEKRLPSVKESNNVDILASIGTVLNTHRLQQQ